MNRFIILFFVATLVVLLSPSCEDLFGDYLEKPPGVDVSIDTVFSSKSQLEFFIASCYEQGMQGPWSGTFRFGSEQGNSYITSSLQLYVTITDEADHAAPWWLSHVWNTGSGMQSFEPRNQDRLYRHRWTAIRMVNTLLENVDRVPDITETYKIQVKGEARFIRARLYFDMFKLYGGMPLVDRTFLPTETEAMQIPRASLDSTLQFILDDCQYAIDNLPDKYESAMKGRITKGAALALKSKALLFAASPIFNTGTPVLSMADAADNRLICFGSYDLNRWQQAADAAKAVIDWAPSGGIHLITDQGPDKNYRYVWEQMDNPEIILADKRQNGTWDGSDPFTYWGAKPLGFQQGVLPTQNFIEKFYDKRDGNPQVWEATGDDLNQKYAELDYRFHQTIGYNGMLWNQERGILETFTAPPNPNGRHSSGCLTGYWIKKFIADERNGMNENLPFNYPWYRLAEFYLNYAEALNEVSGPVQEVYDAVNVIRSRSGMPDLPPGLSQEEMRERIRKERGVEFAFEGHRWHDIRRWLIGDEPGVCRGSMTGLKIHAIEDTDPVEFSYERFVFETRQWDNRFYLYYFQDEEVNKGYLVQNPGW